jgi:hypothetical protein
VVSLERPERAPTIDLSDRAPARLWWRGPLLWTGAVLLYALVLTVQVGLPASISLPQSAIYLYSLAILSIPVRLWMKRSLALGRPTPWQLTLYVLAGLATVGVWFWANMLYNRFTIGPGYWEHVRRQLDLPAAVCGHRLRHGRRLR